MDREHDNFRSLIAAYALGALPPDEERELRAHIVTCDECMAEADLLLDASSKIALAVQPEEPPPGLADRVLALVHEQQPAPEPTVPGWRSRLVPLTAAVALSLVVGVLGYLLIDTKDQLATDRQVLAALLRADQGFELAGEDAVAKLVPTSSGSALVVSGLSKAPDDRDYQLWLFRGDEPVSGGVFEVTDEELALFRTDMSLEGFTGAAVTIEPSGGSRAPTGRLVITSS
jgi:anti-sigma-K factor RskA